MMIPSSSPANHLSIRSKFRVLATLILSILIISLVSQVDAAPTSRMHSFQRSRSNHSQMTLNGIRKSSLNTPSAVLPSSMENLGRNFKEGMGGSRKVHHGSHRKRNFEEDERQQAGQDASNIKPQTLFSRDQTTFALGVNRVLDPKISTKGHGGRHHHHKSHSNSTVHSNSTHSNTTKSSTAADRKVKIHSDLKVLQSALSKSKGLDTSSNENDQVRFLAQKQSTTGSNSNRRLASDKGINLDFTLEKLNQFKSKWNTEGDKARGGRKLNVNGTIPNVGGVALDTNSTSTSTPSVTSNSSSIHNSTGNAEQRLKDPASTFNTTSSKNSFRVSEAQRAALVAEAASDADSNSTSIPNHRICRIGDVPCAAVLDHGATSSLASVAPTPTISAAKFLVSASPSSSPSSSSSSPSSSKSSKSSSRSSSASWSSKPSSQSFLSKSAGLTGPKSVVMLLTSNDENYGPSAVLSDLHSLQKWAGDVGSLTKAQESEVVAAVLSASARYFPELPTKQISRVLLADMKAESDFSPTLVSPGRLDSGNSYGLLQISPGNGSQELSLFKAHVVTSNNKRSWVMEASAKNVLSNGKYDPTNGRNSDDPLLDWKTGERMLVSELTTKDLFRPWVNIHTAAWIQSNLARTKSQDPFNWNQINKNTAYVQSLAVGLSQMSTQSDSRSTTANALFKAIDILDHSLDGGNLTTNIAPTVRTALGSWVAGPASDGPGSYLQRGDDISAQYLEAVMAGVEHLYGQKLGIQWLETLKLNKGLVDYH